jgi:hypothetical protein
MLSRPVISAIVVLAILIAAGGAWFALNSRTPTALAPASTLAGPAEPPLQPSLDLVGRATTALQACTLPSPPPTPDGATASLNQMLAARNEFQAYDAATNAYVNCVDSAVQHIAQDSAKVATQPDLDALRRFGERAHNTAIDQEQGNVDQFNAQLRTYKAKHPHF